MRKARTLAFVAALSVLFVGCARGPDDEPSPTGTPPDPTPARTVNPGQHGPTAAGTFSIEGAFDVEGEYSVLYPFFDERIDECAELAAADVGTYGLPLPSFFKEQRFTWTAALKQYKGPGDYDMKDLQRLTVEVRKTPDADPVNYVSSEGATADVSVDAKNGGKLEFTNLRDSKSGDTISGEATWKCTEGSEGNE